VSARWIAGGLAAAAALTGAAGARAWDSPEHESMGRLAYQAACTRHVGLPLCNRPAHPSWYDGHADLARRATADADYCHSIYFSNVGISLEHTNAQGRTGCSIIDGKPFTSPAPYTTFGVNKYLMFTNKQHFGDHTRTHAAHYLSLALIAAKRYRMKPALSVEANRCSSVAVALAGFANHYVTDRTASGHAWTPATHGMTYASTPQYTVGMLGCFHDQDSAVKRTAIEKTTGFSCVDSAWLGDRVWVGIGSQGRFFGGPFYADQRVWWSDYQWEEKVKPGPTGSFMQRGETMSAATEVMHAVLSEMEGQPVGGMYNDTFVSNFDMCRVAWGLCCRKFEARTTCGSWSDPNVDVTPTCDYCEPDITHGRLMELCPHKKIRFRAENNGGVWKSLYGASVWKNYYSVGIFRRDPDWRGDYGYVVELNTPKGDWSGVDAARTLAATNPGSLHPDAKWDKDNDVVTKLGCPQ
jgi:hypothetical protein